METNLGLSGLFKIPNSEGLSCLWLPHPRRLHLGYGWLSPLNPCHPIGETEMLRSLESQEMEIKGFMYRLDPKPDYVLLNFLFIQEGKWDAKVAILYSLSDATITTVLASSPPS